MCLGCFGSKRALQNISTIPSVQQATVLAVRSTAQGLEGEANANRDVVPGVEVVAAVASHVLVGRVSDSGSPLSVREVSVVVESSGSVPPLAAQALAVENSVPSPAESVAEGSLASSEAGVQLPVQTEDLLRSASSRATVDSEEGAPDEGIDVTPSVVTVVANVPPAVYPKTVEVRYNTGWGNSLFLAIFHESSLLSRAPMRIAPGSVDVWQLTVEVHAGTAVRVDLRDGKGVFHEGKDVHELSGDDARAPFTLNRASFRA